MNCFYGVFMLIEFLTEKAVSIISNSEYLAYGETLFKTLKLFKIDKLYKLKLMKFYSKLS